MRDGMFEFYKEFFMQASVLDMQLALSLLERSMRAVGWWEEVPPSKEALNSVQPFCVDYLTFSQWLQWVYIPKMQAYMASHGALPPNSDLSSIAEEAWRGCGGQAQRLLKIVGVLDDFCNQRAVAEGLRFLKADEVHH